MSTFMNAGLAVPNMGGGHHHHHSGSGHHHHHHHSHTSHQHNQPPPPPGAPPSLPNPSQMIASSSSSSAVASSSAGNGSAISGVNAAFSTCPFSSYHIRDITGYSKSLYHCAWSCNGDYLSVICGDKNVHISQLDIRKGALPTLQPIHTISTNSIMARTAWHPFENNRLAICGDEKFVEIWDVRAAKAAMKLPTQGNNLNVSWSRDGIYLAVGNRNEYFLIFDTRTGALVRKKKFTHEMNEMAWSFQSDYLLVASGVDGMGALNVVSVFNENSPAANSPNATDELTVFDTLIAHSGACQQLAVDPTCRRIAIGGTDRVVSLWSLEDLVCENFVPLDVSTEIRGLSFSPDGQYLAIATGLANSNQASSSQGDEQGVLIVHADSAEPIARVDVRMKCSSIAWQPVVNTSRGELNQQQVHVGNAVNPSTGGNHAPSGEGTHQSHHILAVVCDDKNATLSATTGGGSIGSSSSSILTSGSNSNPVFLRLIVFPCTP